MPAILLRKEPFGGIAALAGGDTVRILDHVGFKAFECVAKRMSDDESLIKIATLFPKTDPARIHSLIALCRGLVDSPQAWETIKHARLGDESNTSFPTLSFPLDMSWEITRKCNQFCQHCYNNSSNDGHHPSWQQLERVLDELDSTQLRSLTITGGEPMMRKDFKYFSERVERLAFNRILSSNATLIAPTNIGWISRIYKQASISIDVANKESYEEFRGRRGSYERCIRGLRLLREHGVDVLAQTTLSFHNFSVIEELADLLASLDIRSWSVRIPFRSGRALHNGAIFLDRSRLVESAEKLSQLREQLLPRFDDLKMGVNYLQSYHEPYTPTENPNSLMTCAAATILATLNADGRLSPCALFSETNFKSEPVWNTSLKEQWQNAACMNDMRNIHLKDIKGCGTCSNSRGSCGGGCRAKSYLAYGTIYRSDNDCNYSQLFSDTGDRSKQTIPIVSG
ncbi:MAG: radical SAM/SPASM domain-containing protein [Achromobacter sp.]|uniref:radical SAM/SPASM domain-containing protein n=1 Tax=Achromobacter sp. TaxID=134375 RepID=UPI003CFC5AA2